MRKENCTCLVCEKKFYVRPSRIVSGGRYCSKRCMYSCAIWRASIARKLLGRHASEETKKKLRGRVSWNKGRKVRTNTGKTHFKKGVSSWNKGKAMPAETREKIRQATLKNPNMYWLGKERERGEKHWNWKGGIARNKQTLTNPQYKKWRLAVFERDGYKCVKCEESGVLQADHILRWANYPELRFNINNGQTLCVPCHKTKTKEEWKNPLYQHSAI